MVPGSDIPPEMSASPPTPDVADTRRLRGVMTRLGHSGLVTRPRPCCPDRECHPQPGCRAPPRPSSSKTDGTSDQFGILSIALQLIHGATEGPPGGPERIGQGIVDTGDRLTLPSDRQEGGVNGAVLEERHHRAP